MNSTLCGMDLTSGARARALMTYCLELEVQFRGCAYVPTWLQDIPATRKSRSCRVGTSTVCVVLLSLTHERNGYIPHTIFSLDPLSSHSHSGISSANAEPNLRAMLTSIHVAFCMPGNNAPHTSHGKVLASHDHGLDSALCIGRLARKS